MALEFKKSQLRSLAANGAQRQLKGDRLNARDVADQALLLRLKQFIFGAPGLSAINDNEREVLSLANEGVRAFIDETVYRARRYQCPLSIILFRIEQRGSSVYLRSVAPKIALHLRRLDLCIPLEPEELLLVLCPELDDEKAGAFARRLTMLIEEQSGIADAGVEIHSTTATLPGAATTFDGLLGLARQRLQPL